LALFALILAAGCGGDDGQAGSGRSPGGRRGGPQSAAAVPVKVDTVVRQDISDYILANTTLEAYQWVDVRSRTSGQVVAILKEEGDPVGEGETIARLDADAARLQVTQMQVAYDDALRNFEREEKMNQRKLTSQERYENAKATLDRARAQLEQAKLNLGFTQILSPVDGVLTIREVELGNMVTGNQVLFSVADFDPLLARIRIPEKNIGKIQVGQGARITVESAPGKTFLGRVKMISPVVNPESGTIKVTIEIPGDQSGLLRPGMFASVFIITETHEQALVIPKKALVLEGEGDQIFVFERDTTGVGKAVRKRVKLGFSDNERLEIVSGLSEGELVITVGQEGLRPGTAVRLVGEGAARTVAETGEAQDDSAQIKQMQSRLFGRFPDLKKAYDERVKKDPEVATNMAKFRAFLGEMREKGVLPSRGGGSSS
jgi:RND family efflux transporter MFP subunit